MLLDNRKTKKVTVEEIEKLDTPTPEEPKIDTDNTPEPVEPETKPEEVVEELTEEVKAEPKVEEPKPSVDYKEKFSESSREAMSLHFKNEKLNSLLSGDLEVTEPTEAELRAFSKDNDADYDELDTFSKNILKRTYMTEKRGEKRVAAYEEIRKMDTWAGKVDTFVSSEENMTKYPSLEGQEEDFKRYCMKETQRGVDFNLLVASFLYENDKIPEAKKKGSMFLSRGNGRAENPKPAGITAGEAENYRVRDPKEYRRLIKSGKIKIEI